MLKRKQGAGKLSNVAGKICTGTRVRISLTSCEKAPDYASMILLKKETVGEPTVEFREETHTSICVLLSI